MSVLRFVLFALVLLLPITGHAQTRVLPDTKEQITLSFAPVVRQVAPAVVNIYTKRVVQRPYSPFLDDPFFQRFFGQSFPQGLSRERVQNALGSGVIVSADGLIVTNAHVIDQADEITVVLADRREFEARLVTTDARTDLALLRIDTEEDKLPYLEMQDSDDLEVGDLVLAIGNPFGVGQTVTSGIVSALARTAVGVSDFNFFIQTDAAINPGNSGGALVSMSGKLVGINSAIYSRSGGSLGIGFAIPSNMVRTIVGASANGGAVVRAWLGVEGQAVTSDIATSLGLPRPAGVLVNGIHPQSPAVKAGLRVGDVVTAVNQREVDDPEALRFRIATLPVGENASLSIIRRGDMQDISIPLIAPPETPARDTRTLKGKHPLSGATVANLSPAIAEELRLHDEAKGVVIVSTASRSPASRIGLEQGDIVLSVNDQQVATVADLAEQLQQRATAWKVQVKRGNQVLTTVIGG